MTPELCSVHSYRFMCKIQLMKRIFMIILLFYFCNCYATHDCVIAKQDIRVDQHNIYYNTAGKGPKILLIHGLFASKEQWSKLMCQLARKHFMVIAPDLPGYGKSLGYHLRDYALENQVRILHSFMQKLQIKKFNIAGNSMGGTIAALYSASYPAQIKSLAFIGSMEGVVGWGPKLKQAFLSGINPESHHLQISKTA